MLNLRARLHIELAGTMMAAGNPWPDAIRVLSDGIDLYRRKGNLVAAEQARGLGG